jgi:hypothetical protein
MPAKEEPFPGIQPENPIDIFDVVAKLGEGSYGSVFKAVDRRE